MTPGLDAGAKNDLAVKESSMPRELAEADAISGRLRKSPCWLAALARSASGLKRSLIAGSIRVAISPQARHSSPICAPGAP